MREEQVDTAEFVPAVLRSLVNYLADSRQNLDFMKLLVVGSDPLYQEEYSQFKRFCSTETRVINSYGVTEATIDSTFFEAKENTAINESATAMGDGLVPIGRPFGNTEIYLLDRHLQPVPIGVPGELHIGGAGLARGYLNQPQLTAEKFIAHPFSPSPHARLYKTGDLARYRSDGTLEFLGRLDQQLKLRGFRIEPGEIEALLHQHPQVQQAVVMVRTDTPGDKRLVAYVVAKPLAAEAVVTPQALRQFLQQQLPDYMVPSVFVLLEALPLTPNGKLDRRALPAPDLTTLSRSASFVLPRTPEEEALAAIWSEVLGVKVGVHDNFFELGGDSILSMQVVARAHQAGLRFTLKQLFQHQSIAELVAVAGTARKACARQDLVTGAVLLTPIQQAFFEQNLPESHHFNQSLLLDVAPELDPARLEQALQYLLQHHDALRMRFTLSEQGWQQVNGPFDPQQPAPFQVIDLSTIPPEAQGEAIETAAARLQQELDLEGSLVRVALFRLGHATPDRLLLIIHHLVVDGVSWRILLEDLVSAYQQLRQGTAIQLPPKTTAFKDWAEQLQQHAQSELAAEREYWLAPHFEPTPLPLDHIAEHTTNTVASAAHVTVTLSAEDTRALLQDVPQVYHTQINDILLTALVQAFARWTGQPRLLVDLEGHGRQELFEQVDLSRTVGWFTTVFPVPLALESPTHPGAAIKGIKEQLRRLPNHGIGYGLLRYLCADATVAAALQSQPQAQVSFNYLGQFDQVLAAGPLLGLARESAGLERSRQGPRQYLLEVNGYVAAGELSMTWTYSERLHARSTIERLAEGFRQALQGLIAHCQSPGAGGFTPSDFALANLDEEQFTKLSRLVNQ
jgi:non-ribosomal peptide synthase protein (TIGR01720 family)